MNLSIENMRTILVVLLVTLFLFILIRELICWYFKINERVAQNNEIIKQLKQLNLFHITNVIEPNTDHMEIRVRNAKRRCEEYNKTQP